MDRELCLLDVPGRPTDWYGKRDRGMLGVLPLPTAGAAAMILPGTGSDTEETCFCGGGMRRARPGQSVGGRKDTSAPPGPATARRFFLSFWLLGLGGVL